MSYQTVSKWETGVNTPDLAYLVPLAKLLHTTTDDLLGNASSSEEADSRLQKLEEAWKAVRYGKQEGEKLIAAARALTEACPENPIYWYRLAYGERSRAYELCGSCQKDEQTALFEQALAHYKMVIEDCREEYWKNEALAGASNVLCWLNRPEQARQYAEQLPEGDRRDRALRECLLPEERIKLSQQMRERAMSNFLLELLLLGNTPYLWPSETIIRIIHNMIPDGNYLRYHNDLYQAYRNCAQYYAREGPYDNAVQALEKAWFHAQENDRFNSVKAEHPYTAPLMDRLTAKAWPAKHSYVKSFAITLRDEKFAPLRQREDFRRLAAECGEPQPSPSE